MDKILWCYHSNETSLSVLSHGDIYFSELCKMKFGNFVEFLLLATFGSERDNILSSSEGSHLASGLNDSFVFFQVSEPICI